MTFVFSCVSARSEGALISSIYGIVDMAMVGQYQGPDGTAALAVVAPVWNIIYSLGLLMGIGGSVIFSTKRGSGERDGDSGNEYFTAAVIGSVLLAALACRGPHAGCAYSVGQAAQPIISTNFGAGKAARIRETLRLALWTTAFFGVFWTALILLLPLIAGPDSIWFAMPITEAAVMLYAAVCIKKDTAALPERN